MLKEHLKKLTHELDLKEEFKEDKDKTFSIQITFDAKITFKQLDPGISISANIIENPKQKKEDIYLKLMHANLLGQGTGGSVIGLDNEEKFLTLSLALPYEISYSELKENLETFTNYLLYWKDNIQEKLEE